MLKRVLSSAALIFGIIAASPSWCQTREDHKKSALPNFDIRETQPAAEPASIPQSQARTLVERRSAFLETFRASLEGASVRIAPNRFGLPKVMIREGGVLSAPSAVAPEDIAKGFLRSHASLFPLAPSEVDQLRLLVKDATGGPTFLAFNQTLNGIDVFDGQIKFTLTNKGEVAQVSVADVVPQLDLPTTPGLSAQDATKAACAAIGVSAPAVLAQVADPNGAVAFRNPRGDGYSPITTELFLFPVTASSARLAYRIYFEADEAAFYEILVDAQDGSLLYRHNRWLSEARGLVWQASPMQGTRQETTFPTAPIASSTDPGPWLSAGGTVTTGNNVDAYLDVNGNDLPDATTDPNMQSGRAYSANQSFDFSFGDGTTRQDPRLFQPAAVTNLFYFVNMAHDYYYSLGFTEAAGNLQTDNYGRGGVGNDAVRAEAQYGGFTDNSAFSPTPDGMPPRMRIGVFTRGTYSFTDDLDADYDGQTVFHEYGHGVSNRLVGARTSTSCLDNLQSGALGEGWSDYFAISNFNNPVFGAYPTQNPVSGIRRYSYEGYPYTYEDIGNGSSGYEVHDDGEIWAATLWDLRKSVGQAVADQVVVDGLKSTPCSPSMTNARDAILAADQARYGGSNRAAIWQVFAKHGMGYSALGADGDLETGTRYDAAYDQPPDLATAKNPAITSNPLTVSTSAGAPYAYTVTATNPNGGTLRFVLTSGPPDMTVNPLTGAVNWTAGFVSQRVKITVTDGQGGEVVHGYLLPVMTRLADGVPVVISGPEDDAGNLVGFATFTAPANAIALQVTLRNGTGDADLYVDTPQGYLYLSARSGNNETLTFPNPSAGVWQIAVDGWLAYSGVSLTAALITPTALGANASLPALSGVVGSETLYRVTIPAGTAYFTVSTSGGTGDVDLYLSKGGPATCQTSFDVYGPCVYDYSSEAVGNAESITVTNPAAADWYIDVSAYAAYSGVTLTTYATAAPPAITTTSPLPSGSVGTAYSQALSVVGGSPPYSWSLSSGALPAGLTLSTGGTISGTPTTAAASIFTVQVQDSVAATAAATFALVITQTAPCSYSVSPASQTFIAAGGPATIAVTAAAGCAWTASSPLSWVSITSGATGTGNGSVAIQAASNGDTNRSGSITVAGQSVPIHQASTLCTFAVYPAGQAFSIAGGTGTIAVTAPAGCAWSVSGLPPWVVATGGRLDNLSSRAKRRRLANGRLHDSRFTLRDRTIQRHTGGDRHHWRHAACGVWRRLADLHRPHEQRSHGGASPLELFRRQRRRGHPALGVPAGALKRPAAGRAVGAHHQPRRGGSHSDQLHLRHRPGRLGAVAVQRQHHGVRPVQLDRRRRGAGGRGSVGIAEPILLHAVVRQHG
ncbi:MAG: M36 family metallopeptidase [Bryobacteraceae bacterium]